jgi:hypothetical protein
MKTLLFILAVGAAGIGIEQPAQASRHSNSAWQTCAALAAAVRRARTTSGRTISGIDPVIPIDRPAQLCSSIRPSRRALRYCPS